MFSPRIEDSTESATQGVASTAIALNKVFGHRATQVHALRDVNLQIPAGVFTAIMGPSGSGKSTLLHCLAALDTPTSGHVFLGAIEVTGLSRRQQAQVRRERIGFIFQAFNLVPTLDAYENIVLPQLLAGYRPDPEWLEQVVTQVGLRDRLRHRPTELSGGQQQRVAVARALMGRPDVIFADEPTGNLDTQASHEVLQLLRQAVEGFGQTVVTVTHDPIIASYADQILFFHDGQVVDELDEPSINTVLDRLQELETSSNPNATLDPPMRRDANRPDRAARSRRRGARRRQSDQPTPPMVGSDEAVEVARQERWLQRIREQFESAPDEAVPPIPPEPQPPPATRPALNPVAPVGQERQEEDEWGPVERGRASLPPQVPSIPAETPHRNGSRQPDTGPWRDANRPNHPPQTGWDDTPQRNYPPQTGWDDTPQRNYPPQTPLEDDATPEPPALDQDSTRPWSPPGMLNGAFPSEPERHRAPAEPGSGMRPSTSEPADPTEVVPQRSWRDQPAYQEEHQDREPAAYGWDGDPGRTDQGWRDADHWPRQNSHDQPRQDPERFTVAPQPESEWPDDGWRIETGEVERWRSEPDQRDGRWQEPLPQEDVPRSDWSPLSSGSGLLPYDNDYAANGQHDPHDAEPADVVDEHDDWSPAPGDPYELQPWEDTTQRNHAPWEDAPQRPWDDTPQRNHAPWDDTPQQDHTPQRRWEQPAHGWDASAPRQEDPMLPSPADALQPNGRNPRDPVGWNEASDDTNPRIPGRPYEPTDDTGPRPPTAWPEPTDDTGPRPPTAWPEPSDDPHPSFPPQPRRPRRRAERRQADPLAALQSLQAEIERRSEGRRVPPRNGRPQSETRSGGRSRPYRPRG